MVNATETRHRTIVPEEKCSFGRFRRRFCDIRFHGEISIGAMPLVRPKCW
jgi:hypothetical protein